jgi:hypothetical protein
MRLPCFIIGLSTIGLASISLGTDGVLAFPGQMAHMAQLVMGRRPNAGGPAVLPAPVRDAYEMVVEHLARPVTLTELGFHPKIVQVPSLFPTDNQIRIQPMPAKDRPRNNSKLQP